MAIRRPLIAGLGTTGVLVAFAALLLVVVGALLGFRAWPGGGSVGDAGGVTIKDARLTKLAPVTLPTAAPAIDAVTRSVVAKRGKRSHARGAHDAQGVAGEQRSSAQQAEPASGGGGGTAGGPSGSSSQPGVSGVSDGVANTVNRVTQTAGGGLGGNSTPVGKVVLDTGNAVSNTVQQLGADVQRKAKLP
jgi:hypothetical protein